MTDNTETPAEVLAEMREWGNGEGCFNDNPEGDPQPTVFYPKKGWDQLCDRLERSLAAGRVAPVAEVCDGWTLRFVGSEPLADICARHPELRIGSLLYTAPPADPANPEQVLQLLIAGGFVDPAKVNQARGIIAGCEPAKASGSAPDVSEADGEVYELPTGERRVQLAKHARDLPVGTKLYATPPASAPEVTDSMVERACIASYTPDDAQQWANVPDRFRHKLRARIRAALTAALQQEGKSHG